MSTSSICDVTDSCYETTTLSLSPEAFNLSTSNDYLQYSSLCKAYDTDVVMPFPTFIGFIPNIKVKYDNDPLLPNQYQNATGKLIKYLQTTHLPKTLATDFVEERKVSQSLKRKKICNDEQTIYNKKVKQAESLITSDSHFTIKVKNIYYESVNSTTLVSEKYCVRLVSAKNTSTGKMQRFIHGADAAGKVIRLSNISRLFGPYKSPEEKMKMNVPSAARNNTGM